LGKVGATGIECHWLVVRVEVETAQFLRRQLLEQMLRSGAGIEPLLFQLPEIDRADQILSLQVALLVAGMAVRLIEEEGRGEATDLAATGKGQDLVGGEVGLVEAVTEFLVRKDREETEGGVRRPVEPNAVLPARHLRPEHAFATERPLDGISLREERLRIRLC